MNILTSILLLSLLLLVDLTLRLMEITIGVSFIGYNSDTLFLQAMITIEFISNVYHVYKFDKNAIKFYILIILIFIVHFAVGIYYIDIWKSTIMIVSTYIYAVFAFFSMYKLYRIKLEMSKLI